MKDEVYKLMCLGLDFLIYPLLGFLAVLVRFTTANKWVSSIRSFKRNSPSPRAVESIHRDWVFTSSEVIALSLNNKRIGVNPVSWVAVGG